MPKNDLFEARIAKVGLSVTGVMQAFSTFYLVSRTMKRSWREYSQFFVKCGAADIVRGINHPRYDTYFHGSADPLWSAFF